MYKTEETTQKILSVITESTTQSEMREILKLSMDSIKNATLQNLLTTDFEYQKRRLAFLELFKQYKNTEFTAKQQELIDTMMARKDEADFDYIVNVYMAGIFDGYRILKEFDLTNE